MTPAAVRQVAVLHLEDEPKDAKLVRSHLAAEGIECDVTRVETEAEFRAAVERGGYDLVLADHSLPEFDGLSALVIARDTCPEVPFICVSGSLGEELAIEALKNGATDYVLKHRLSRLGPAVRRALEESEERARRRHAEAEVLALEAQLRHSQKLEAVGQLAGGIAHDFNNLLTVINGYCERLLLAVHDDDPVRADLDLIHNAGQRAAALTRQLLAFSRRQVLQPRAIDLNGIVSDMQRILARVLGEPIAVTTRLDPLLGSTQADPGQVEQVIMNLAINARDAMPDGGAIAIETANVDVPPGGLPRSHLPPGPYVVLAIRDTGHGMDAATMSHIFEPFFTTKEAGKGTGLGLSTVYGIVVQSGGDVAVESAPGQGTTMRVYLPRVAAPPAEAGVEAAAAPIPRGSETLLLVEDEDFVRELVREFLQSAGYTVIEARNAEEAIALVAETTPAIDLLVTDVVLPGLNGAKLAERLRAERPTLDALYISGYPGDAMFQGGFDPGPAFLAKPFTRHTLTRKVRELLNARPPTVATVLVVEPDADIRRLLVHMLSRSGYAVVDRDLAGPSGERRPIDVALVDVSGSETSGLAVLRSTLVKHPRAEVVLMAGAFGEGLVREATAHGVSVLLQKPLAEANVLDAVVRARAARRR